MKIEFYEKPHGLEMEFTPETPEEVSQLFRFINNAKSERPLMHLSFSDQPKGYLSIRKKEPARQKNYVKAYQK